LIAALFSVSLNPQAVLQRSRIVTGDILHVPEITPPHNVPIKEPWVTAAQIHGVDAALVRTASTQLRDFTRGQAQLDRGWLTLTR
jgi:hypothetical protein